MQRRQDLLLPQQKYLRLLLPSTMLTREQFIIAQHSCKNSPTTSPSFVSFQPGEIPHFSSIMFHYCERRINGEVSITLGWHSAVRKDAQTLSIPLMSAEWLAGYMTRTREVVAGKSWSMSSLKVEDIPLSR